MHSGREQVINMLEASRHNELIQQFTHEDLRNLLMERDTLGNHIGSTIAINYDAQTLNNYVNFILAYFPEQAPTIFIGTNKKDEHIGHHIAQYQTVKALAGFLATVRTQIPTIWDELALAGSDNGSTIGHFIAMRSDSDSLLIDYLSHFSSNHKTLERILSLKNPSWTIAHLLARQAAPQQLSDFISFLFAYNEALLEKIISEKTPDGWTVAMIIVNHQKPEVVTNFLSLPLFRSRTTVEKMLLSKNVDGWTIAMLIARYQTLEVLQNFLPVLFSCGDATLEKILSLKTQNNWTIAHLIARHQTAQALAQFLLYILSWKPQNFAQIMTEVTNIGHQVIHLLTVNENISQWDLIYVFRLIKTYAPTEFAGIIHHKCHDGTMLIARILATQTDPGAVIYELLTSNIVFNEETRIQLASKQESVLEYINTFPSQEKIGVLEGIKNNPSELSAFFAVKRGWFETGIRKELDRLLVQEKSRLPVENRLMYSTSGNHTYKPPQIIEEDGMHVPLSPLYMTANTAHVFFQPLKSEMSTRNFQALMGQCPAVPAKEPDVKENNFQQGIMY